MSYWKMTRLACYIAPAKMDEWEKSDIGSMVESCGSEETYDFLNAYQNRFGIDLSRQMDWVLEMEE